MTKIEDHQNKGGQKKKTYLRILTQGVSLKNTLYEMRWALKDSLFIHSHCDPAKHRKTAARKLSFKVKYTEVL